MVPISATSSARSGIYSTSWMIYGLAQEGNAPQRLARPSRTKVSRIALLSSCMFLLYAEGGVDEAFTLVTTTSALCFMFV